MAEIDIYKRKLFGGLTQPEFQEIVDYSKSIGGIPSVDVNRSVTARDVIAATPYLNQPTGGTAVEAVSNFNNFLAGVLSNKFARVDEEKQAAQVANAAATERVMNVIADTQTDFKDRYKEVGENLIDLQALQEGAQPSDYIVYQGAKEENLKDRYMVVNNQLVDLAAEGKPQVVIEDIEEEKLTDRFKVVGTDVIDLQKLADSDDLTGAVVYEGKGEPTDAARYAELMGQKADYESRNEEFPTELAAELEFLTPKEAKPYVPPEAQKFVDLQYEVAASADAAETQYQTILDAEKFLLDPRFTTGVGTSTLTPIQEFFDRFFGFDIDNLLEGVNIDVLNNPADTASLQKATTQLAMNVLGQGKLPGAISDFEFRQMMFSVFNVDSPKEANLRFLQGMKYLYEKDMAKGRIASTIDPYDKFSLKNYQDALRAWDEANRPLYLPSPTYLDDVLNRMPTDLKEG
jgi:hypothetical protein